MIGYIELHNEEELQSITFEDLAIYTHYLRFHDCTELIYIFSKKNNNINVFVQEQGVNEKVKTKLLSLEKILSISNELLATLINPDSILKASIQLESTLLVKHDRYNNFITIFEINAPTLYDAFKAAKSCMQYIQTTTSLIELKTDQYLYELLQKLL